MAAVQDACPPTAELSRPNKVLCGEGSAGAGAAGKASEPIPGVHVPGELPRWISERIRTVRDGAGSSAGAHAASTSRRAPGGTEPHCVLYWMSTAIRGHENPALDVAKAEARRAGDIVRRPLSVQACDIWHHDHSDAAGPEESCCRQNLVDVLVNSAAHFSTSPQLQCLHELDMSCPWAAPLASAALPPSPFETAP